MVNRDGSRPLIGHSDVSRKALKPKGDECVSDIVGFSGEENKSNIVFCRITFSSVGSFSPEVGTRTFFHAFALISISQNRGAKLERIRTIRSKAAGGQRQVAELPIHGLTSR